MRKLLKVLNPLIFVWNYFKYTSYLSMYENGRYVKYNFEKYDTKYF